MSTVTEDKDRILYSNNGHIIFNASLNSDIFGVEL